jgi:hypothetical protein
VDVDAGRKRPAARWVAVLVEYVVFGEFLVSWVDPFFHAYPVRSQYPNPLGSA